MRHAAPKAHKAIGATSLANLFTTHHGSHSVHAVTAEKAANGDDAQALGIDPSLAHKLNEVAPLTRRSIRQTARAAARRNNVLTSASLAALVGTAATSMAFVKQDDTAMFPVADGAETTQTLNIARINDAAASRSDTRESLTSEPVATLDANTQATQQVQQNAVVDAVATTNEGDWNLGDSNKITDVNALSKVKAANNVVAERVDSDESALPSGFDPNHATGDSGNAYPWGQCTWWSYERRHQLGLNTGSYFGNAQSWGASASALGYWVDNTARAVGDVIVFAPGQEGASAEYGHVAIVEAINPDGSIKISESNAQGLGVISSREFTAAQAANFTYVHY